MQKRELVCLAVQYPLRQSKDENEIGSQYEVEVTSMRGESASITMVMASLQHTHTKFRAR